MERTTREAIRAILRQAPGSIRELAREAGLTHSALRQAAAGDFRLSPESARRVVEALRRWSRTTAELADRLETVLERERKERANE